MKRQASAICILAAATAVAAFARPADAWWKPAWKFRRAVTVPGFEPSKLPGDDVGVVTMPTAGKIKRDGSDIRVATPDDREVPCRVLMTGPGDQVRVAFALRPKVTKYYVYFGNPEAPAADPLDIRRGVLLEMWAYPGGALRTLEQVEGIFRRTRQLLGRDVRDRIFSAHNPFGPRNSIAAIHTGWLNARRSGQYVFAVSSQNASFLLVDDKVLISNGGLHAVDRRARQSARISLEAGLHKLTFYHVSPGGHPYAVLAWRPPWQPNRQRFTFVPPGAFAPFVRGAPEAMEEYGKAAGVDFLPEHLGETFMSNRYYQRYGFNALAPGRSQRSVKWTWDFGDGQTSTDPNVEHVYLLPGQYTVKLTGAVGAARMTQTNGLYVSRPWDRVTDNRLDTVRHHADIVLKYDLKALPAQALGEAVLLFERARMDEALMKAGAAFVSLDKVPPRSVNDVLPVYARRLVAHGKADEAIAALRKASRLVKASPDVSASMLVEAGRIMLEHKGDDRGAAAIFEGVIDKYVAVGKGGAVRLAQIGLGDVWRTRGDANQARQAYQKAKPNPPDGAGGEPFVKGDYARHVEEYIRTRDYEAAGDYLQTWQEAFPLDKLEGYWSLLVAQLAFAQGRHAEAVREAQVLVKVNPASNYGAELLMIAYDAHLRLRQPDQAKKVLRQIVKDFPESPLAAEAAKKLGSK
ncbi:MAG TPA: tetratricopeptide repeat protein [Phycisphaerae bacterium]|nr:tetratricopeptide repeat protein [Phycisphaerae bacterium]HUT56764.1 tetratricopeptide repeat protein [Phycisphaerae bacterium]